MGAAAILEKIKPAARAWAEEHTGWFAAWIARLRAAVAEIAAAKSFQQYRRDEEKEE
jgi:hypothetical protein